MLSPGARLGNFEIIAPLRSGGMAVLYLARRRGAAGFARLVAIKVIHGHLASDEALVAMFLDEARLAARIQDPHVVHVEELGEDVLNNQQQYFIVMEFVHGRSLGELLRGLADRKRRMSPTCAVNVATQIARGLEAAHEARGKDGKLLGVVHRDVSPQNVLISFRGYVKLIDFGIAKARGQSHHTADDSLRGKLAYMSPEQAWGKDIDARTDIYALGVVLWEMLTSQRLFQAPNEMALLERVRAPEIVPPSRIVPDISPALDALVLAALEPDVNRRLATAREFGDRLASVPEARGRVGHVDLAALLEAVVPDNDPAAPWRAHTTTIDDADTVAYGRPPASPGATQAALDTLSVISDELPSASTGSTVLALEQARDDATRWKRRAVGMGVTATLGALAVSCVVVVLLANRTPPTTTQAAEAPPPATSFVAAAPPESPPAPPAAPSASAPPPLAPAPKPATPRPTFHGRPHASAHPATTSSAAPPARSIEMINGVPMVRDKTL